MGTVTFDGSRLSDAESTSAGGSWTDSGGGSAANEPDFVYQGSGSVSEKVKSSELGIGLVPTSSVDFSTTARTAILKVIVTTVGILSDTDSSGGIMEIGSGGRRSNYYRYYIAHKSVYPAVGGWLIVPIDPNISGYPDATVTGAPSLTALNWFGWVATMTSTSAKSENIAMDAIDYIDNGTGLTITGTSSVFQDFIDFDQGNTSNRYGIVSTKEGILYVTGVLTIATAVTSAAFSDSNKTLVFPDGRYDTGFCGLDIDLTQGATSVTLTSCTFIGRGHLGFGDFDTTEDVASGTEIITTNQNHNFTTGDAATYSNNGGSSSIGITSGSTYYINAISDTTLYVYDSRVNAVAGGATGRQNLTATAAASSERHDLTRTTDTRPDFGVTSTSGSATLDACVFTSFRDLTLTSAVSISDSTFNSCHQMTQSSATLSNCTFNTPTKELGVAFLTVNNPAAITSCTFNSGSFGHAIELNSSTAGNTYSFSANTFTDYGPQAISFNTTSDVTEASDTVTETSHGYTTGSAIIYHKHGGTAAIGLTDATVYYVRAVSSDTLGFYESEYEANNDTNRIALTSTGNETHNIYSMNAAIYNNSGGTVTLNITNSGTYPLSYRNSSSSTTTVSASVSVTVTIKDSSGNPIPGVQVAIFQDNASRTVLQASTATDENGQISTSAAQNLGAIIIRARQSTDLSTFNTGTGISANVITIDQSAHDFSNGDPFVYDKNGGSQNVGMTDGTTYYAGNVAAATLQVYTTAAAAIAGAGGITLTAGGTETHNLDPIRYVSNSATGTIGSSAFSAQITMITDNIATG